MTELVVRDVHKTLGSMHVLKGASFSAERGRITALLGSSGSGKTTLLRSIAGLERPESGRIEIGGKLALDGAQGIALPPEKRDIGLVFQSYALWPHRTVFENVAFGLRLRNVSNDEITRRVQDTLDRLGLGHLAGRYPDQLSGGQQQRVAICRALVYQPKVLLLDEPLSNLDAKLREEARYWIRRLILDLQICAVFVTHDQGEALAIADRILLLKDGAIIQDGPPQAIYSEPTSLYAAQFFGANNVIKGRFTNGADGSTGIGGEGWHLAGTSRGVQPQGEVPAVGVMRVERVRIAEEAGPNRIRLAVDASIFLGDRWEYRLSGQQGLRVVAFGPAPLEGQEVWCELPARDLWIFPDAS